MKITPQPIISCSFAMPESEANSCSVEYMKNGIMTGHLKVSKEPSKRPWHQKTFSIQRELFLVLYQNTLFCLRIP